MGKNRIIRCGKYFAACVVMAGLFAGCGEKEVETPVTTSPPGTLTPEADAPTKGEQPSAGELTPEAELTPEVTPTLESEYDIPDMELDSFDIPQNDALAFVKDMKIGWNLGNTFDASDCTGLSDELAYESAWCKAKTSEKLVKAVKEAGFQTIRIPVSWHNHVEGDDYRISEAWIARVQEVVDMAVGEEMNIILNIHHDNSTDFMYPTSEYLEQSKYYVTCIWQQIAERFAEYDERLIFETLNEPRMVGTDFEWWINPNDESCKDAIAALNELNQAAVDTIRATGGNNAERYIMIPGYCASADGALNDGFVLPKDSAKEKLIVSVHAYTPYNFALDAEGTAEFDSAKTSDVRGITDFMDKLYNKYIKNGIPVVIGEFGARSKGNVQARIDFSVAYIAAARARGITCCWWDNNAFLGRGENFGLIDRLPLKWRFEEIVQGLMKYAE